MLIGASQQDAPDFLARRVGYEEVIFPGKDFAPGLLSFGKIIFQDESVRLEELFRPETEIFGEFRSGLAHSNIKPDLDESFFGYTPSPSATSFLAGCNCFGRIAVPSGLCYASRRKSVLSARRDFGAGTAH